MMQYKGYFGKVEYDDEARILHGEVLGVRDVITFQADKASKIEKAFHDSVDDYLAFCKERGEEPDRPFSGQLVVRMDPTLHRKLAIAAEGKGKSLNAVICEYLLRELEATIPEEGRESQPASRSIPRQRAKAHAAR